jgi:hypothetical protein
MSLEGQHKTALCGVPHKRFFRTVRDQFLLLKLDLSCLEALNRQFTL